MEINLQMAPIKMELNGILSIPIIKLKVAMMKSKKDRIMKMVHLKLSRIILIQTKMITTIPAIMIHSLQLTIKEITTMVTIIIIMMALILHQFPIQMKMVATDFCNKQVDNMDLEWVQVE